MRVDDIIAELKTFYEDGVRYNDLRRHLGEVDVERWTTTLGCSLSQLFDMIAMHLASGYFGSELSFEFCDAVVNDLFGPVIDTAGVTPTVFWDVYLAFDQSEYFHGNKRDEDPKEVYTRPMIARVLEAARDAASHPPSSSD